MERIKQMKNGEVNSIDLILPFCSPVGSPKIWKSDQNGVTYIAEDDPIDCPE